jgi:hypothetical protein
LLELAERMELAKLDISDHILGDVVFKELEA